MGLRIGGKIEEIDGKSVSYIEFVEKYMKKNEPILVTGLMDGWRACNDWVCQNGQPNLHFFSTHFGKSMVQVAECGRREFTDQKRIEMSVSEFVTHWLELQSQKCSTGLSDKGNDQQLLYLKDWHFVKEYPEYLPYTTPPFFVDDWLNLYLDSHSMHSEQDTYHDKNEISCSDYRFVYMGAKGTWTPLHADVFRSYSWSANVCGKKQWHFLSPSQCHLLFDRNMKRSVYDIFENVSDNQFPGFKKTIWLECTQGQDEIIFVPSGWYHQVHNLEDTISINHNWFNGYNLSWVWNLLVRDYNEAKGYIDDIRDICDDFEGVCQRNLAVNTGMNYFDFLIFITRFSFANLTQLNNLLRNEGNPLCASSGKVWYLISNLISIRKVTSNMVSADAFTGENCSASSDIKRILEEPEFLELCVGLNRTCGMIDELFKQCSEVKSTSSSTNDPLLLNYWKSGLWNIELLGAFDSKVSGPKDLITIIDHAIKNVSSLTSDCSFSLSSELNEFDTTIVV